VANFYQILTNLTPFVAIPGQGKYMGKGSDNPSFLARFSASSQLYFSEAREFIFEK
jgi:hypothetical protein